MADKSGTFRALITLSRFLPKKRLRQLQMVMALMFVGAFAETMTIGAIAPFLGLITRPDLVAKTPIVAKAMDIMGWTEPTDLIVPLAIGFCIVVFVCGVVRVVLAYVNNKFSHRIGYDLGVQVYSGALHKPYSDHVLDNSSNAISGMNKVTQVVNNVIKPLMIGTSSLIIALFIIAAMMLVNFKVALTAAGLFGGIYFVVTLFTRRPLRRNSIKIAQSQTRRFQVLQEGIGGIRDVILDHAQAVYIRKFKIVDTTFKNAQAMNAFMGAAPRYVIESTGMIGMVLFATYVSGTPGGLIAAIPVLGALALGAQRLMPLLQQIFLTWSQVLGTHQELHDVIDLLEKSPAPQRKLEVPERMSFERSITFEGMSFQYTSDGPVVLDRVNLVIPKGARIGFIGKTGSGKSTLIDLVMGLLEPTDGSIAIDGVALSASNRSAWQRNIAHVPQTIFLVDDSIAANIAFGKEGPDIDMTAVARASRQAELAEHIESQPMGYDAKVGERGIRLSGGQRQRIGIARALYKQADVLVLDEATSALDSATESAVMTAINALSRDLTILVIAHRLTTLAFCDTIIELDGGRVARVGSYADIVLSRNDADHAEA